MTNHQLVKDVLAATLIVRNRAMELHDRLEAGGANDGWAQEVDRLMHLLDQTSNYVANDSTYPTAVQFNNGRAVKIVSEGGKSFLDVSFVPPADIPQPPPTETEKAALDSLKNSDFIERLVAGEFETPT